MNDDQGIIKVFKYNSKWELIHYWLLDDFGFKRVYFDLFDINRRIKFPFQSFVRVTNYSVTHELGHDDIYPLSDLEYKKIAKLQLKRIGLSED